jgi:hypothetical protein
VIGSAHRLQALLATVTYSLLLVAACPSAAAA